ncbi:pyrroloquinoline quinone-dependent dehydrogenase [Sphingomonas sp.]|uniref:pyrroloquinoline quinone-dependent dehydrogenase n=1 Tax=Sphingomonas sp. TaxID=28214 RepID=UPI0025DB53C9|nr:pyrroloquinoline quinone-dependent dehydrogenase [Sphingomonas sp.]
MKRTRIKLFAILVGAFIAISFLGGSAFWNMLGLTKDLTIDGRAEIVRPLPGGFTTGWAAYGGDGKGTRFSAADQITPANVQNLETAWEFHTGAFRGHENVRRSSAFENTPILVENMLVLCTQFNQVIALDPAKGTELWRFDPKISTDRKPGNQYNCRGVSYWKGTQSSVGSLCASRIFMGTVDSRLIALDAITGKPCPDFGQQGQVQVRPSEPLVWPGEYQITSAPAIIGNTVITGSAITDSVRTKAPLGTVHAYDTRTGALKWEFNPIPQDPNDPAADNWAGNSARGTGHANIWSTISVDEERGMVFLPTSSPSPDYYGGNRVGDNRYANSVVALNAETGKVIWQFQTVHHDLWDFDVPAQPGLYQVWRGGKAHDVVAQVTKTGMVFVLDRDTGKPFLPVEERPVPQGGVPGEVLSPTQPFPVNTPLLVNDRLNPADAFGITLWDKLACSNKIKNLRGDGLFTPSTVKGTLAYPFYGGGANWGSAAYDASRNLMVVNLSNVASFSRLNVKELDRRKTGPITDRAEAAPMEGAPYTMSRGMLASPLGLPCSPPPWGVMAGVDLSTGKIVWRRTIGTTRDLAPAGIALPFGTPNVGGPAITRGGLIFLGATLDNYLRAFDVSNGRELWKGRLPAGGQATPMTYIYHGRQYVVIAAGGHAFTGTKTGDSVMAFALPVRSLK